MNISTKNMSHHEWLQNRRLGIGGSDAPAILGLSPYKTPLDVYLDKIGMSEPLEETDAMWFGKQMEAIIAQRFMEKTGLKVQNDYKMRFSDDTPYLLADIDRLITGSSEHSGPGVLEIKTTSYHVMKRWLGEIDPSWYIQLQHYLYVSGYSWGAVAFLADRNYQHMFFERDENLHLSMKEIYEDFWGKVQNRIAPDPAEGEDISKLYKFHVIDKMEEADESTYHLFEKLVQVKEERKDLEKEEKNLKSKIQNVMKDAEALTYQGEPIATWKATEQSRFQSKKFKEDYPDLFREYSETNSYRKFLPKT